MSDISPEALAAFDALSLLARWLPSEVGPATATGLGLVKRILERETDPMGYLHDLIEADAQRQAKLKFG